MASLFIHLSQPAPARCAESARITVRIEGRSLTAHLPPIKVVKFAENLADGVCLWLQGQTTEVALQDGYTLRLDDGPRSALVSVLGPRPIVRSAPVDRQSVRLAAESFIRELLHQRSGDDPAERLKATLIRLADAPHRHARSEPPIASDLEPLAQPVTGLALRLSADATGLRIFVQVGALRLHAHPQAMTVVAEGLTAALETLLQAHDWPVVRARVHLDRERVLKWVQRGEWVEIHAMDRANHPLAPPVTIERCRLAAQVLDLLNRSLTLPHLPTGHAERLGALRRTAVRLAGWSAALSEPDELGLPAPAPTVDPRPAVRVEEAPLPIDGLQHLAYRRAWRADAPGLIQASASPDRIRIFDADGLTERDPDDGTARWRRSEYRPIDGGAGDYALNDSGALVRLDTIGRARWRTPLRQGWAPFRAVQRLGAQTLVAAASRHVACLDIAGKVQWTFQTWAGMPSAVVADPERIWIAAEDGFLYGLARTSGVLLGRIRLAGDAVHPLTRTACGLLWSAALAPEGTGRFWLLDPVTGACRWRRELGPLVGAPMIDPDHLTVLIERPRTLVRLAIADGRTLWTVPVDPWTEAPQIFSVAGLTVLKDRTGRITAVDADGTTLWHVDGDDAEQELAANSPPVPCRGLLLVPGVRVRAIHPGTGRIVQAIDCGELVPGWMHVWPSGNLAIAEDDALAGYRLGGHLALV